MGSKSAEIVLTQVIVHDNFMHNDFMEVINGAY